MTATEVARAMRDGAVLFSTDKEFGCIVHSLPRENGVFTAWVGQGEAWGENPPQVIAVYSIDMVTEVW